MEWIYYTGASYADLDNDGNLDVIINCIGPAIVLKNNAPIKTMMNINFKEREPIHFGIEPKTWLFYQRHQTIPGADAFKGFQSSCEPRVHFGLNNSKYIDSILVVWQIKIPGA